MENRKKIKRNEELVADTNDRCLRFNNLEAAVKHFKALGNDNAEEEIINALTSENNSLYGHKWYYASDFDLEF